MLSWIAWLIALISTTICICIWFYDVRRIMKSQMSTVESASMQLLSCRKKEENWRSSQQGIAIMERSESIYSQAVDHYNTTLHKFWIYIPARLMGFED